MNAEERQAVLHPGQEKPSLADNNQIKRVIAVMSGKGGVGKSLVTGLLATSLVRAGHRVGHSGCGHHRPQHTQTLWGARASGRRRPRREPIQSRLGIKIVSINLALENEDQAVIWRGPIITRRHSTILERCNWGRVDELLVDLPPGTSMRL